MASDLSAQVPPFQTPQVTLDLVAGNTTQVILPDWCKAITVRFFSITDASEAGSVAASGTDGAAQGTDKLTVDSSQVAGLTIARQNYGENVSVYLEGESGGGYAQVGLFADVAAAVNNNPVLKRKLEAEIKRREQLAAK